MIGLSFDNTTLYAAGYDNKLHVCLNFEEVAADPRKLDENYFAMQLKRTPLCMEIWKDNWVLIGG